MKAKLIAIKYMGYHYKTIQPKLVEIAGHFDKEEINPQMEYSLHTENSLEKRDLKNEHLIKLNALKEASHKVNDGNIPHLWYNNMWSEQFSQFIVNLVGKNRAPKIIEVHPPSRDYCDGIDTFLNRYSVFENFMNKKYPESVIAIENMGERSFLIHSASDVKELLQKIKTNKYKLKLMLDIPQLFTALGGIKYLDIEQLKDGFKKFEKNKELITGIHVCGKSHIGDLNRLFNNDVEFKENFLIFISGYFNDGIPRYLVPEVNFSNQTVFDSIINDLIKYFEFI